MKNDISSSTRVLWVVAFAAAMALVEAAVVVYLRRTYYPEGFSFPLRPVEPSAFLLEIGREVATIVMLVAVGTLAGRVFWERFGYTMIAFGVWDIAYYAWLKIAIHWPHSLFDWDVLFLLPLPWIGPVIAPLMVAITLTAVGCGVIRCFALGLAFRPPRRAILVSLLSTLLILFSFMRDLDASLRFHYPKPYLYPLLILGVCLYAIAYFDSVRSSRSQEIGMSARQHGD
jgi:hypothetical protein